MPTPDDMLYQRLGELIRVAREKVGLSQDELATRIALARSSISNLEKGRQRIQIHTLYSIAAALDVPVPTLLPSAGSDDPRPLEERLPDYLQADDREFIKRASAAPAD